ncbi:hypothetical protein IscW_ISCW004976 [Ixodes scapularis]|uniref:Uncharacterized protein n=1 Tax=Ixodes scapularis TaxID=6945 RepID=B7PGV6_IXOSC|nr:hypothetical protein IscW_ISCW004976 [Ixodes scapularis]|eukprot:XP_002401469.1 hypothetical protein IscW_ISCW004976 [Ixodes scapularis]
MHHLASCHRCYLMHEHSCRKGTLKLHACTFAGTEDKEPAICWRLIPEKPASNRDFGCASKDPQVVEINPQSSAKAAKCSSSIWHVKSQNFTFLAQLRMSLASILSCKRFISVVNKPYQ